MRKKSHKSMVERCENAQEQGSLQSDGGARQQRFHLRVRELVFESGGHATNQRLETKMMRRLFSSGSKEKKRKVGWPLCKNNKIGANHMDFFFYERGCCDCQREKHVRTKQGRKQGVLRFRSIAWDHRDAEVRVLHPQRVCNNLR